jgi:hypothetical protein
MGRLVAIVGGDRSFLRDPSLKLSAKGLLALLLEWGQGEEFSGIESITPIAVESRTAVGTAFRLLQKAGYLRRDRVYGVRNYSISGHQWTVRDSLDRDWEVGDE